MKCFIIATLNDGDQVIGYRVFDADAKGKDTKLLDVGVANFKRAMKTNFASSMKNAVLAGDEVIGTNGSLDRYAKLNKSGKLLDESKQPLVILNELGDVGYTVVNYMGDVKKARTENVVKYARGYGIANGKIVTRNNVEYVSSIDGAYEQVKINASKSGRLTGTGVPILIDNDYKKVAEHARADAKSEMEYSDVFKVMNSAQRKVVADYYAWYTVKTFEGLAKGARLEIAPGKLEKLAQLRGVDKWRFAGINDSLLEGRFDAKCELGHSLRYEYFAIPDNNINSSYIYNKALMSNVSTTDYLREHGAIVFGETCAGDFFSIRPENMRKLVKTRKTMSDEITEISDALLNHTEKEMTKKCTLLYLVIKELKTFDNVKDVFGSTVGNILCRFLESEVPFTMSLVLEASEYLNKTDERRANLFKKLFSGYSEAIDTIFDESMYNGSSAFNGAYTLLTYFTQYLLEGDYKYDPLLDRDGLRKDVGKYNDTTRKERHNLKAYISKLTGINVDRDDALSSIGKYISLVDAFMKIADYSSEYMKKHEQILLKAKSVNNLSKVLLDKMRDEKIFKDELVESIGVVAVGCKFRKGGTDGRYIGGYKYGYFDTVFFICNVDKRFNYRTVRASASLQMMLDRVHEVLGEPVDYELIRKTVDKVLGAYNDFYEDIEKDARSRDYYYTVGIINKVDVLGEDYRDVTMVTKLDYDTAAKVAAQMREFDPEGRLGITIKLLEKDDLEVSLRDMRSFVEISSKSRYEELLADALHDINVNRRRRIEKENEAIERERHKEIERKKEEEEKRLAEEEERKKEAEKQKAIGKVQADVDRLRRLLNELRAEPGVISDYGVKVSMDILKRHIAPENLSDRQLWRLRATLKHLDEVKEAKQGNKKTYYSASDYGLDKDIATDATSTEDVVTKASGEADTNEASSSIGSSEQVSVSKNSEPEASKSEQKPESKNEKHSLADNKLVKEMLDTLLALKDPKKYSDSIDYAVKIARTISRNNEYSDKQYKYLRSGYKEYILKFGASENKD